MTKSETFTELPKALIAFQRKIKDPQKGADNPFMKSKYVPFDGLVAAVRPILNECGLAFTQEATTIDTKVQITTSLWHESGEFLTASPLMLTPTKSDPQSIGSAITYGKRYSLQALLGVAWEDDDDGNSASQSAKPTNSKPKAETKAKAEPKNDERHELLKKITAVAKGEELNGADIGRLIKFKYGAESSKDLSIEQLKELSEKFVDFWEELLFSDKV